jgi:hypothetical protein
MLPFTFIIITFIVINAEFTNTRMAENKMLFKVHIKRQYQKSSEGRNRRLRLMRLVIWIILIVTKQRLNV